MNTNGTNMQNQIREAQVKLDIKNNANTSSSQDRSLNFKAAIMDRRPIDSNQIASSKNGQFSAVTVMQQ